MLTLRVSGGSCFLTPHCPAGSAPSGGGGLLSPSEPVLPAGGAWLAVEAPPPSPLPGALLLLAAAGAAAAAALLLALLALVVAVPRGPRLLCSRASASSSGLSLGSFQEE